MDTIHNNIYVPVRQFPLDPASATTGQPGILIFHDPAPTQPTPARSQAALGSFGTVSFTSQGRTMNVNAFFAKGIPDAPTELVITTTVGNEVVSCGETGGQANCVGTLTGDPLIGGMALLGSGGKALAKSRIVLAQ